LPQVHNSTVQPNSHIHRLAIGSILRVRQVLGRGGWRVLRLTGMNYLAYAFVADFCTVPARVDTKFLWCICPSPCSVWSHRQWS
jgi:hypothetical protein